MTSNALLHSTIAHIVHSHDGTMLRLTLDDTDASMAHSEGFDITINATLEEILSHLEPCLPKHFMDDATWQALSPKLKELADHELSQASEAIQSIPSVGPISQDMPAEILQLYIETINRTGDFRVDLLPYVEASELAMARIHNRHTNPTLFSEVSLGKSWDAEFHHGPLEDLIELAINADDLERDIASENSSEQAAFGDSAPGSYRTHLLARLSAMELQYAVDCHPDAEDEPGLSPG